LFIEQGPIVQIKSAGRKKKFYDKDPKIEWDKPLVIVVNSFRHQPQKLKQLRSKIIKEELS
jgi:hypothetical protein